MYRETSDLIDTYWYDEHGRRQSKRHDKFCKRQLSKCKLDKCAIKIDKCDNLHVNVTKCNL